MVDKLDILILGPVPPPFGGVAVHISRLIPLLRDAGLRVGVLNHFSSTEMEFVIGTLKKNPWNYYRLPKRFPARLVHYHHSRWSTLIAVALGKGRRGTRYMITIHSSGLREQLTSKLPLLKLLTTWALRRFDTILVVNPSIRTLIQDHLGERRVEMLPAFLEPVRESAPYDASVEAFLSSRRTLVVPVFRIRFLKDGRDVYGLDTAVEAFIALAEEQPELGLAFFIAEQPTGGRAMDHLTNLRTRLQQEGLTDRTLIAVGLPFVPALRHDVIVVRPTRTDGDALSIREALHAGVPVIASDSVERPVGAVTFFTSDPADLSAKLRRVLGEPTAKTQVERPDVLDKSPTEPFVDRLMRIYYSELDLDEKPAGAR